MCSHSSFAMNIATGTIRSSEHLARYSCFPVLAESSTRSSICMSSAISASLSRSLSQLSSLSHSSSPSSSPSWPCGCSRGSLMVKRLQREHRGTLNEN